MWIIKDYEDKEEIHNTEQITCKAFEALIKELIKEFNRKIKKERISA